MKLGLLGGNTKAKILDLRRECGTMLELLDFAEYFVTSNIRREFVIGETGMYRKEIPEIPAEAIREAVANALCHRDYTTGTSVEVNVFMDTVQIVSPGLFSKGDSPEKHLESVASEFRLRNPAIARTLFRAGVIEQYGTGIPRIKESCEAAGVRFRFEQTVNSTIVVFERPGSQVNSPNGIEAAGATGTAVDVSAFKSLDGTEKIAVQIARDSGRVTKKALMERAGVGKTKATENPEATCRNWASRMGRIKPTRPKATLSHSQQEIGGLPATARYCPLLPAAFAKYAECRAPIPRALHSGLQQFSVSFIK